jgi:hypothetical protein
MARRLNWERASLMARPKLSISDEREFLDRGFTKRWLERAEERAGKIGRRRQPIDAGRSCASDFDKEEMSWLIRKK